MASNNRRRKEFEQRHSIFHGSEFYGTDWIFDIPDRVSDRVPVRVPVRVKAGLSRSPEDMRCLLDRPDHRPDILRNGPAGGDAGSRIPLLVRAQLDDVPGAAAGAGGMAE